MSERYIRRGFNWERYGNPPRAIVPQRSLIYRDDFDGTQIDRSRWGVDVLPGDPAKAEDHWNQEANVNVSSGSLKITSRKEPVTGPEALAPAVSYATASGVNRAAPRTGLPAGARPFSSGLLSSKAASTPRYYPLFSRFEIRAKLPHGQGIVPSFLLRRRGGGAWAEVAVMEYLFNYRPGETQFAIRMPNSLGDITEQRRYFDPPQPGSSNWHTWAVEIRPAGEHADPLKDPILFTAFLDDTPAGSYRITNELALRDLHMVDRVTGERPQSGGREIWEAVITQVVGGRTAGAADQQLGYLPILDRCSRTQAAAPGGAAAACDMTDLFFAQLPAVFEVDYVSITDLGYTA